MLNIYDAEQQRVAKPETWDNVAETYNVDLEEGDYQLASEIEAILTKNGLKIGDSLIEMGCGSGHLSACLAQKGYKVTLLDFSPVALGKAKATFAKLGVDGNFIQGDLFNLDTVAEVYDYAWNSGVMEHFGDSEITTLFKKIGQHARKGVLYLVPNSTSIAYLLMRARLMADEKWPYGEEYLRRDYKDILKSLGYNNVTISYISTAAISAYQLWKAEREQGNISELYKILAEENMLPESEGYLCAFFASNQETIYEQTASYSGTTVQDTRWFDLIAKKIGYTELKQKNNALQSEIAAYSEKISVLTKKYNELQNDIAKKNSDIQNYEVLVSVSRDEINQLKQDTAASQRYRDIMQAELNQMGAELSMSKAVLRQKDEYMVQAQVMCDQFATGKLMKLNHFLYRFKGQLLRGNKETRAEFWSWLKGRINHTNRSLGEGVFYNPWMTVRKKLSDGVACRIEMPFAAQTASVESVESLDISFENDEYRLLPETRKILTKEYQNYDVIILSVIDYNFRHQRPQHFAIRFAANGHRVFYVNANFVRPDRIVTEAENLYIVDFSCNVSNAIYTMNGKTELEWMKQKFNRLIFEQAICDAIVIVDYPNWVYGAEYLRSHYGFKMITDYMDDYTGFLSTTEDFLKDNCTHLLKQSDLVVASSQFLFDVACKYTEKEKISIIRNGTEVKHFYQAAAMKQALKERKIIGYYGAVAHWFAWGKVCYLANAFQDCDIVIVGEVTEYRDKLSKFSNIKLLGEKPYTELPCYLADFDVCLIPFDTSTDLIKATNPVKFYEYLSAGKKIVATEIPELMPYRDEYVYMSNDDKQFAEYVKMCLDGTDLLKSEEKCIAFARENDWQERYVQLEATCQSAVPMVSIIVLTYNNLELNRKCFDSIISQTAYANYELIIVDNCSTDGTVEYLKEIDTRQYPNVRVILNEENTGFAEGNNIGISVARGQYVLLLNNDTVVSRGWLTSLTKHLENNMQYGMCNPTTNSIGNESMIIARYTNLAEMREFAYTTAARHMGEEYHDVNRLPLFATLIRKSAIDQIGMLDTEYKVGMFEDDDFTERMIRADYQIVIADDVFIHHVNNGSFKKLSDEEYKKIFETNKALFEKKWNRKWTIPKYRKGVTATINEGCHI